MDTLQWIGNSEDSDKATAAQAGGDNEEGLAAAECRRGEAEEEGGMRGRNSDLLLRVFEMFSRLAVSSGGQRGGDCIDGFCSQVEREREPCSNAAKLVMQKSTINHRVQCSTL